MSKPKRMTKDDFNWMLTQQWEALALGDDDDPCVERIKTLHESLHGNRRGISDEDAEEYIFLSWALAEAIKPFDPEAAVELHEFLDHFRVEHPCAKTVFEVDPKDVPFKQLASAFGFIFGPTRNVVDDG